MNKHHIQSTEEFFALRDKLLFTSKPVSITLERIRDFCRGTLNEEWIHWDRERCQNSHLGDIIAPGLFLPALYPGLFWQHMEIDLPRMIVKGIEGIRVYRPVRVDTSVFVRATVARVENRTEGIEVHYHVEFFAVGEDALLAEVTFINRYWDN